MWVFDLLARVVLRRIREDHERTRLYWTHKQHHLGWRLLALQNADMPRAEFTRRCGYRFPLPAHVRRKEG